MQLEFTRTGPYEYSCTVHGPTDPYVAQYNTVQLYSRRKLAGIQRSLGNRRISQNRRNLQNRNSAAAEIAIRFGPKILLKCDRRESGPKFRTIGLDYGYKSSFYTQSQVQSLRPAHTACRLIRYVRSAIVHCLLILVSLLPACCCAAGPWLPRSATCSAPRCCGRAPADSCVRP
jgi:hypothetical protein